MVELSILSWFNCNMFGLFLVCFFSSCVPAYSCFWPRVPGTWMCDVPPGARCVSLQAATPQDEFFEPRDWTGVFSRVTPLIMITLGGLQPALTGQGRVQFVPKEALPLLSSLIELPASVGYNPVPQPKKNTHLQYILILLNRFHNTN